MILSSKKQFILKYIDGTKIHSIRAGHRWRAGMSIQFYQDNRSKNMRKFMEDGVCKSTQRVFMTFIHHQLEISIDDEYQYIPRMELLAKHDGFESLEDFTNFFFPEGCKHDSFSGQIIHWTNFQYY